MALPEDVSLVVEKIEKAFSLGDQCSGMAWGKSIPEWTDIFNEASGSLKMPVVPVAPLQGGSQKDLVSHITNITRAFQQTAGKPAIVLADTTGNQFQKDPDVNWHISNYVEKLTKRFPKAVYVQVVPENVVGGSLQIYCMNPTIPRDPSKPIYPV